MTWPTLKPGDIVDVIAPASHGPIHKLEKGCEWLTSIGLIPRVPHDLIDPQVFFAAPLKTQLKHLVDALHSDSKAIWCLRGGYGSMRLVPELLHLTPTEPKAFLGFSDITALHLFFNQHWNWPTLHSRNLGQMSTENAASPDRKGLEDLLSGKIPGTIIDHLIPLNQAARKERVIHSEVTGGNLRIVQSSLGLSWQIQTRRKIVFLEDVDERGYSIHRMLEQLHGSGHLSEGPAAVVFGDFTGTQEADGKDHSLHALETFAERVPFPVFRGAPSGHGDQLNFTLPFHTPAILVTGQRGLLSIKSGSR